MRTAALCWELGGGFGHLTALRPLAARLAEGGWRVAVLSRNLPAAATVFDADVGRGAATLLQAPFRYGPGLQFDVTPTYAYILHNVGWGDGETLTALASGWRNLFELVRPDVVVADHSPTALLAARSLGLPAVVRGTGFYCPPDVTPLPTIMPWRQTDAAQVQDVERRVLENANRALAKFGTAPLARLADLFHDGPSRSLLTYPELDHYPGRTGEVYRGHPRPDSGLPPLWPESSKPRVFAYVKPFRGLETMLKELADSRLSCLAFVADLDPGLRERAEGPTLRFVPGMLDLRAVGAGAAAGVTNANIGTMTALLLAGVPLVSVPLTLEQSLVARAVTRLGAGVAVPPEPRKHYGNALNAVLSDGRYRAAAAAFADRHRTLDPLRELGETADECERLVARSGD